MTPPRLILLQCADPRWADPIKNWIKRTNQARAVNEVVSALKDIPISATRGDVPTLPPLRVVNGISTPTTSSIITTAAR